jgi:hypothetical protein
MTDPFANSARHRMHRSWHAENMTAPQEQGGSRARVMSTETKLFLVVVVGAIVGEVLGICTGIVVVQTLLAMYD